MKDRIHLLMTREKMSQKDFADMLGIPAATLSNIFAEKTKPTLSIAMKINESFPNISLEWLLTGKGNMYKEGGETASEDIADGSMEVSGASAFDMGVGASGSSMPSAAPSSMPLFDNGGAVAPKQPSFAGVQMVKNTDKSPRRVTEIRVFYDDNTFESFYPKGKA